MQGAARARAASPGWSTWPGRGTRPQLDDDAARLLVELVGPEVGLLVSEVEKLAVYVGDRRKIHRDDVARMVGAGRIETIWKVLDAATTGRGDLALEHLDRLLTVGRAPGRPAGGDELLAAARSTTPASCGGPGSTWRKPAARRGSLPFAVEKTQQQHAHLGPRRVDQLPALLLQADLDLKGSSMLDPRTVLERLLVQLSTPPRGLTERHATDVGPPNRPVRT